MSLSSHLICSALTLRYEFVQRLQCGIIKSIGGRIDKPVEFISNIGFERIKHHPTILCRSFAIYLKSNALLSIEKLLSDCFKTVVLSLRSNQVENFLNLIVQNPII